MRGRCSSYAVAAPEPGDRYGVIGRCRPVSRLLLLRGGWSWAGFAALFAFTCGRRGAVDSAASEMAPAPGVPKSRSTVNSKPHFLQSASPDALRLDMALSLLAQSGQGAP